MESILIIDDDISLWSTLQDYFTRHDMALTTSCYASDGLEEARSGRFDLVLLNRMLPDGDGIDVLRRLRRLSNILVILLISPVNEEEQIIALESGADDCLIKPFNPRELIARIRAALRRKTAAPNNFSSQTGRRLSFAGFDIDTTARSAYYRGIQLNLTDTELVLLGALLESPGIVLGREELSAQIFQRPFHPFDRGLDMLVSRLRRKLEIEDNPGAAIRTIRSNGYVFYRAESQ